MANNAEFTMTFRVREDGSLVAVEKEINKAGKAVNQLTTAQRAGSKASDEHNYKLNQGVAATASAGRNMSKLAQRIGSGPNGLVGAYATLAANAFAVSAAFNSLRSASQVEQMMKGLEVQGARTGKTLLGTADDIRKLTNYSVSAADAMQTTAMMASAGFSTKGMKDLTRVAFDAALALGRNVPDALDRLSKGVTKLEPELLDELGIMTKLTEAQATYALANHKSVSSLTSFEKRQAMLNAVIAEGTVKFGGLSDQVDANPYDQLASSFSNLTNNGLSLITTVLQPLVSLLGGNQAALFGGVLLFASTIRKALLPAMYEMGKKARAMSQDFLDQAEAAKTAAKEVLAKAKADREAALTTAKASLMAPKVAAASYSAKAIQEGNLSDIELLKQRDSLQNSIDKRQANIDKGMFDTNAKKRALKEAELKQLQDERDRVQVIYDLQKNGESIVSKAKQDSRKSDLDYIKNLKLSSSEKLKAEAVELAGVGKIRDAWQAATASAKEYSLAVAAQSKIKRVKEDGTVGKQGLVSKAMDKVAQVSGTIGIFARTGAAAFMKFLPYVGMAATALGTAWSVYENFIKSDAAKAHTEALKKLALTLDMAAKSAKELNRINESSVGIGMKAAKTLEIQSNVTSEIAGAFEEARKTAIAKAKGDDTSSIWGAIFGGPQEAASYLSGVAKSSVFLKPITDELANSAPAVIGGVIGAGLAAYFSGGVLAPVGYMIGSQLGMFAAKYLPDEFNGIDEAAMGSAQAVYQLSKVMDKDLYNAMVKTFGSEEKLANSPAMRQEFIKQAALAYAGVAEAVKSLQEAFKQADTSVQEFFTSAVPKTSFDGLVKGYQAINDAFYQLGKSAGGADLKQQFALLTTMPENLKRLLSVGSQSILQTAQEINNETAVHKTRIDELQASMKDADSTQKKALQSQIDAETKSIDTLKARQNAMAGSAETIKGELVSLEKQTSFYKQQEITNKNLLTLHNARMKSESDFYALSAEGEARRIDMENRSLDLQAANLKAQKAMIDIYIAKLKATKSEIDANLTLFKIKEGITREEESQLATARQQAALANKNAVMQSLPEDQQAAWATTADSIDKYVQKLADAAKDKSSIEKLMNTTSFSWTNGKAVTQAEQSYFLAAKSAAVEIKKRDTLESSLDTQKSIVDLQNSANSLAAEIEAIYESKTSNEEKAASVEKVRVRIQEEQKALQVKIVELTDQNLALEGNINESLSNKTGLLNSVVRNTLLDYKTQLNAARLARQTYVANETASINLLKTKSDGTKFDEAGITNLEKNLKLNTEVHDLGIKQLELKMQQSLYEAVIGKGIEDNISKLEKANSLEQKRLDLIAENIDKQAKIAQNKSEIAIIRTGGTVDEKTQRQFAVENAKIAYEAAQRNEALRINAINAEYDLLDAQKAVDEANLKSQVLLIRSMWQIFNAGKAMDAGLAKNLGYIEDAATKLQNADTSAMRASAVESARQDTILARQAYEKAAAERDAAGKTGVGSVIANRVAVIESRKREEATNAADKARGGLSFSDTLIKSTTDQVANLIAIRENTKPETVAANIAKAIAPAVASSTTSAIGTVRSDLVTSLGTIGDKFGARKGKHTGIDVEMPVGTELPATIAGRLKFGTSAKGGNEAYITGENGVRVAYAHLSEQYKSLEGTVVKVGDIIGKSGGAKGAVGSGDSTGPHAHYSVTVNGKKVDPLKPVAIQLTTQAMPGSVAAATAADQTAQVPTSTAPTAEQTARGTATVDAASKVQAGLQQVDKQSKTATDNAGKAATDISKKIEDVLGNIAAAYSESMRQMQELGPQMADRLGQDFGPQGKVMESLGGFINTLSVTLPGTIKTLSTSYAGWAKDHGDLIKKVGEDTAQSIHQAEQLGAAFSAAAQTIGAVAGLVKSISDAKIAAVDKEIAAEEKKDGKSAASVAKIDALEKKKDAMARKSFNTQKKLMMAQAVMSTAAAVASTWATMVPVAGPIVAGVMAGIVGAAGLAQIAIISGTQYESSYSPKQASMPSTLSIGKRSDTVDLARGPNANAGGEVAYLRGSEGTGSNASNYRTVGSAYGGELMRGYGNRGFVVGEKGPEVITPETPISVTPANDVGQAQAINAHINIQALDSQGVQDVLVSQKGNIIKMLRQAANASGKTFMEDVNVNVYTRPSVGKL